MGSAVLGYRPPLMSMTACCRPEGGRSPSAVTRYLEPLPNNRLDPAGEAPAGQPER